MNAEEIQAEQGRCRQLPNGRSKAQRLEALAEQAAQAGDPRLEVAVLLDLVQAYEYSAEREKMPVAIGKALRLLDRHPAEIGQMGWHIHWRLKWMTTGMGRNPAVPLSTIYRWLDELESRYRQAGYSARPVLAFRSWMARATGDPAAAATLLEQSIAAPRDRMADCEACERGDWGDERAAAGDDVAALEHWAPVLDGGLRCSEEPHRTLAKALLPMLRAGRADAARGAFLRGYPMVCREVNLLGSVARHVEFCALTGNEARGLEILAEHASWLADKQIDVSVRFDFLAGALVLLRRLAALGHDAIPLGGATVGDLLPAIEAEARQIAARYDERNGAPTESDWLAARLAQPPLTDFLPLGGAFRLPALAAEVTVPGTRPAGPPGSLDELVAQARQLTEARHPHAGKAWARVTAAGQELPADVAAEATRARAAGLMGTDPEAARPVLLDAAGQFAALGDLGRELDARAAAAVATQLAGDPEAARADFAVVLGRAEAAFPDGGIAPRYYLNVRLTGPLLAAQELERTEQADPAGAQSVLAGLEAVRTLAAALGQRHAVARCHELMAQVSAQLGDRDGLAAHLNLARENFLAAGQPWSAAYPEATLAQLAFQEKESVAAEELAREALAHGAEELDAPSRAQLSSLLMEAIGRQRGREEDLAAAALAAAARWDGISEPDALHSTFTAARAYYQLHRHGEAVALFAQATPKIEIPYARPGIARTRGQYGRSLRALGRHREAAEQFLEAARLMQDDQDNAGPHAVLAALAAEELQKSGQREAALPAFLRAAELFGALGDTVGRVRALRSAAWLRSLDEAGDGGQGGADLMRSVLGELEALVSADGFAQSPGAEQISAELEETRKQLTEMLEDD